MRVGWDDAGRTVAYTAAGAALLVLAPGVRTVWRDGAPVAPFAAGLLVLVAVAAPIAIRQVRPLTALAVGTGAGVVGAVWLDETHLAVLIAFAELLFAAVLEASRRASDALCWVAGVVVVGSALARLATEGAEAAVVAVLNTVLLAVPVMWAREVRHHRETARRERERVEAVRGAAVAAERSRMARDLHDVVAGQLSGIALQSEAALTVPGADAATMRRVLENVRRDSVASLGEMRALIGLLRADGADEPHTAPAGLTDLDGLLDRHREAGVPVTLRDERGDTALPAAVDLVAYRVVAEALTNAAKHAPGAPVRVALRGDGAGLTVEAENALVDVAVAGDGTGTGLLGLRERAAAIGGTVTAGPDGRTWRVRACLPT